MRRIVVSDKQDDVSPEGYLMTSDGHFEVAIKSE